MTVYVVGSHPSAFPDSVQIRAHITQMLKRKNLSLESIVETLTTYHDNIDVDDSAESQGGGKIQAGTMQRAILENLIAFLEGCT
jgi:beta-catenin-like protein 1